MLTKDELELWRQEAKNYPECDHVRGHTWACVMLHLFDLLDKKQPQTTSQLVTNKDVPKLPEKKAGGAIKGIIHTQE